MRILSIYHYLGLSKAGTLSVGRMVELILKYVDVCLLWKAAKGYGKIGSKVHIIDSFVFKGQQRVRRNSCCVIVETQLSLLVFAPDPDHVLLVNGRVCKFSNRTSEDLAGN
jgi:hypothetical protein